MRNVAGRRSRNYRGFTLVELLVVIAIIAVLVSLLLPAVNSAREAARRTICANHLSQTGLAVLNYESANSELPPGGIVAINPNPSVEFGSFIPHRGAMISWVVLVLPFLEEQNLADQFDHSLPVNRQPNNPQARIIPSFVCPSDQDGERKFILSRREFAKGNYAAFVSPYHIDLQLEFPGALGGGGQSLVKIVDGISKTLLASEVRTRVDERDQRGVWALPWNGASSLAIDSHHDFRFPWRGAFTPDPILLPSIQVPNTPQIETVYDCSDPRQAQLDGVPCENWTPNGQFAYISSAPRSQHPGGVNAVFLDRHVTFLTNDIDPYIFALLVSIQDRKSEKLGSGY